MEQAIEAKLAALAAGGEFRRIEEEILQPSMVAALPGIAGLFLRLGEEHEAARNWIDAVNYYRIASGSFALHVEAAPDYPQRRQRLEQSWGFGWKFTLAHRRLLEQKPTPRSPAEEPLTVPELWNDGHRRLLALVRHGAYEDANRLLLILEALRDDNGDRGISTSCTFEKMADDLVDTEPETARWFYQKAAGLFRAWVSSASSGGEGTARSSEPATAESKLARLEQRLANKESSGR